MKQGKKSSIEVQGASIGILARPGGDFISLTDMVRNFDGGGALIEQWLKSKDTVLFLGVWERLNNPEFNSPEFEGIGADLRGAFPDMSGFSGRNLRDMKRMWLAYSGTDFWRQAVAKLRTVGEREDFLQQLVAEVPWGQHLLILNKLAEPKARFYYLRATAHFGWSRNVLLNQIKALAYERAVKEKKTHNFARALPEHFAEQAGEMMKSRYNLEFLGTAKAVKERELENRLIDRLQQFILELGYGFSLRRPPIPLSARPQGIFRRSAVIPPHPPGTGGLRPSRSAPSSRSMRARWISTSTC